MEFKFIYVTSYRTDLTDITTTKSLKLKAYSFLCVLSEPVQIVIVTVVTAAI